MKSNSLNLPWLKLTALCWPKSNYVELFGVRIIALRLLLFARYRLIRRIFKCVIHINVCFFFVELNCIGGPIRTILIVLDPNTKHHFLFLTSQLCAFVIYSENIRNTVLSKLSTFQADLNLFVQIFCQN